MEGKTAQGPTHTHTHAHPLTHTHSQITHQGSTTMPQPRSWTKAGRKDNPLASARHHSLHSSLAKVKEHTHYGASNYSKLLKSLEIVLSLLTKKGASRG
jgi:hypothetical protein